MNVLLLLLILLAQIKTTSTRVSGGSSSSSGNTGSSSNTNSESPYVLKPITPTSFSSNVILTQTIRGTRSRSTKSTIERRVNYALLDAPVFSYGYSFHGGFLFIPDARALRIRSKTELATDSSGNDCFQNNETTISLKADINNFFVRAVSFVHYSKELNSRDETYSSETELKEEVLGQNVTVNCTSWYNQTIFEGRNCSSIQTTVEGAIVLIVSREDLVPVLVLWQQVVIVLGIIILIPGLIFTFQRLFKRGTSTLPLEEDKPQVVPVALH